MTSIAQRSIKETLCTVPKCLCRLDPEILLLAYRTGIFPMADARDDPEVFWVEPRRRAMLPLDHFHCSHSLAKVLRRGTFEVTCNRAFERVIVECAAPRRDEGETWIIGPDRGQL